jgi:all-trans-retinol dehydrogenase (NAD+)
MPVVWMSTCLLSGTIAILGVALRCMVHPRPRRDLTGWTVVVTGAAQGLGREAALRFSQRGCTVVLWDIKDTVFATAKGLPGPAFAFVVDVADAESVREAAEQTMSSVGPVDVLVNNAGVVAGRCILEETPEQASQVLTVNLLAAQLTVQAFLPGIIERGRGHIVTIASVMAHLYACDLASYCASKAALLAWHNCLRLEVRRTGRAVGTTVVLPYALRTDMFRECRLALDWVLPQLEPAAVADAVVDAVEWRRTRVVLPPILSVFPALQCLLPPEWTDWLLVTFAGAYDSVHGINLAPRPPPRPRHDPVAADPPLVAPALRWRMSLPPSDG